MNDIINLNGSVVGTLPQQACLQKIWCIFQNSCSLRNKLNWIELMVINGVHTSVIPLIAPLCRKLYGKGQESSVLDVNAGYIHCTNNQYNVR